MIFDTDVLIWVHRGHAGAARFVDRIPVQERNLAAISYLELMYGSRDTADLRSVQALVQDLFTEVVPVNEAITNEAVRLMKSFVLAHRLDPTDALIGATALVRHESLATANFKHFRFLPGLQLERFRP